MSKLRTLNSAMRKLLGCQAKQPAAVFRSQKPQKLVMFNYSKQFMSKGLNFTLPGLVIEHGIDKSLDLERCRQLKIFGVRLFCGSVVAKVRVAGLQVLQRIFSEATDVATMPDDAFKSLEVDVIVERHLFGTLSQSSRVSGSLVQVNQAVVA